MLRIRCVLRPHVAHSKRCEENLAAFRIEIGKDLVELSGIEPLARE
jgi:hypothetical protein